MSAYGHFSRWHLIICFALHLKVSALLDINIFIDFVNATFVPILLLAVVLIVLANKYYHKLV